VIFVRINEDKQLVALDSTEDIDENGLCVVPFGVREIGYRVFANNNSLKQVFLPNSLVVIGESAFMSCENLMSVSVPIGVKELKKYAFCGCKSLLDVRLPESLTIINNGAFGSCPNLSHVKLSSQTAISLLYCQGLNQ
jgi:hypothetical protein